MRRTGGASFSTGDSMSDATGWYSATELYIVGPSKRDTGEPHEEGPDLDTSAGRRPDRCAMTGAQVTQPGVLLAQADVAPELEPSFDEWYDSDHIPKRLALPGFASAERYHTVDDGAQRHAVVYHLRHLGELDSPEYEDVLRGSGSTEETQRMLSSMERFTRYTGALVSDTHPAAGFDHPSPYAVFEFLEMPPDAWGSVTALYEQEIVPPLVDGGAAQRIRRYRVEDSRPPGVGILVIYECEAVERLRLAHEDALERGRSREGGTRITGWSTAYWRRVAPADH